MSPCHILARVCASIKHKLLLSLRSSNVLAQGIFFFPNCYFSSASRWWVNFSSVFSSLSKKDRDQSLESQQGLRRIKWNPSPLSRFSQSTSKPSKRCWRDASAGNIIFLCNFSPVGVHFFVHFEAACHLLAFLTTLKPNLIGNVHNLWSLLLLFLIVSSIWWFVCCGFEHNLGKIQKSAIEKKNISNNFQAVREFPKQGVKTTESIYCGLEGYLAKGSLHLAYNWFYTTSD